MTLKEKIFEFSKSPTGDLIVGFVFEKFSKLLPVKRIKETDKVIAFWHPKPFWEKHIVIVPKKAIKSLIFLTPENSNYISEIYLIAKEIVQELAWDKTAYSILINGADRQEVGQIHFHLYSGKQLKSL